MQLCSKTHSVIVHDGRYCPLCSLKKHDDSVHDFIESKGKELVQELVAFLRKREISDNEVATTPAGADGINPSKLSDNGPAHQIDALPLAGSPSDNTSQPEMSVTPSCRKCAIADTMYCDDECKDYSNFIAA